MLAASVPLVATLHDAWLLTGHCAHPLDSDGWQRGCGRCPHLDTYPPLRRDGTAHNLRRKRAIYAQLQLAVVTPCASLMAMVDEIGACARRSDPARYPARRRPRPLSALGRAWCSTGPRTCRPLVGRLCGTRRPAQSVQGLRHARGCIEAACRNQGKAFDRRCAGGRRGRTTARIGNAPLGAVGHPRACGRLATRSASLRARCPGRDISARRPRGARVRYACDCDTHGRYPGAGSFPR